jgi:ribonuclease P protein component
LSNPSTIPPRFTYPKAEHLKSRKAIEQLFKSGQSFFVYPYKVVYQFIDNGKLVIDNESPSETPTTMPTDEQSGIIHSQFSITSYPLLSGFAASTRNFKHAVDRNRIKRLGKEAYRLNKHALIEQLGINQLKLEVFFIFTDKKLPDWKLIEPKMQACLKKLIHLTKKHHEKLLQG